MGDNVKREWNRKKREREGSDHKSVSSLPVIVALGSNRGISHIFTITETVSEAVFWLV